MIEKISDLKLFKRIVELGTLSAAAGDMGLSPGSASLRLAAMERSLGTKLFRRTTRQLHLTEAGESFLETASSILNELTDFDESLSKETGNVSGIIRVTAPVDLGRNYIAPSIDKFLADNPDASINLICTDRITDLTERGIDLAIRYGALRDSSLKLGNYPLNFLGDTMPRPTKDTQLAGLEKLRQIAERDPMKALEAFVGQVVNPPANGGEGENRCI